MTEKEQTEETPTGKPAPETTPDSPPKISNLLSSAPAWFAIIAGIIYSSGFLVVSTFLGRLGIRESGAEFWKGRYIHIGILCMAFPIIINGTIYPIWYIYKNRKIDSPFHLTPRRVLPLVFLLINLAIIFYVFAMFYRPNLESLHLRTGLLLSIILLITILGIALVSGIEKLLLWLMQKLGKHWFLSNEAPYKWTIGARWFLVCLIFIADIFFLYAYKDLTEMLIYHWKAVTAYIIFVFCSGYFPFRAYLVGANYQKQGLIRALVTVILCIVFPIYYLIICAFALSLYIYIPAVRGGGDYTVVPRVICFINNAPNALRSEYFDIDPNDPNGINGFRTKELIIIEETSKELFAALCKDPNEPFKWRRHESKPIIISLNRENIKEIVYKTY